MNQATKDLRNFYIFTSITIGWTVGLLIGLILGSNLS